MSKAHVDVVLNEPIGTINPNIYGHFMEHLGACIYDGAWVGEDSPIPNTRGFRNDVVAALKQLKATSSYPSRSAQSTPTFTAISWSILGRASTMLHEMAVN